MLNMDKETKDIFFRLYQKINCLKKQIGEVDKEVQFFDNLVDFPVEGVADNIYVDNSTGQVYIWDGSGYITYSEVDHFVARQAFEPYYDNPSIELLTDGEQFERFLDAHYIYVPGTNEHRISFVSILSSENTIKYRYASSLDNGKTWSFDALLPAFFEPLGSGDEIDLHEHLIYPLDANNWRMYYQAKDASNKYRTKLATSTDGGLNWVRQGVVLDVGGVGEWDEFYAGMRNIIKLPDNTFYAAYEGRSTSNGLISGGVAKSVDGITWTKIGQVIEADPLNYPHEGTGGLVNDVKYINGVYVMMYGTKQSTNTNVQNTVRYINIAISYDGITYNRYPGNPIINLSDYLVDVPGSWNYGTEDFISWSEVPGKEGAYTIITRGRPIYLGGPVKWNYGLYWFGNRINSDDILDANLVGTDLILEKKLGKDLIVDLSSLGDWINDGTYYGSIKATGTALQNGAELLAKVASLELLAVSPTTLIVPPGIYDLNNIPLEISSENFTLTSLNGENNVNITGTVTLDADNTSLIGVTADFINFTVAVGTQQRSGLLFKNCEALNTGSFTYNASIPFAIDDSVFENCISVNDSFIYGSQFSSTEVTIKNCIGGENCFFHCYETLFQVSSVIIENCIGTDNCYFFSTESNSSVTNSFINNCIGGENCFGRRVSFENSNFYNIRGADNCVSQCSLESSCSINSSNFISDFLNNTEGRGNIRYTTFGDVSHVLDTVPLNFLYCMCTNSSFQIFATCRTKYCLNEDYTTNNQN
jgi:hypothetical protein